MTTPVRSPAAEPRAASSLHRARSELGILRSPGLRACWVPRKPKGTAKTKLNARGKAKVVAEVTYTPAGGAPNTESTKVKLVKR